MVVTVTPPTSLSSCEAAKLSLSLEYTLDQLQSLMVKLVMLHGLSVRLRILGRPELHVLAACLSSLIDLSSFAFELIIMIPSRRVTSRLTSGTATLLNRKTS